MGWTIQRSICFVLLQIHVALAAFGIPDFLEMGGCADVKTKKNFDPARYSGMWFTIETVENEYEQCKACINTNYTWTGDHFALTAKGLDKNGKKIRKQSMMHANEENPEDWAHMTVDAEGVPAAPYKVVATDYTTYSCVYSCMSFVGFRAEFFWFMSRTPTAEPGLSALCQNSLSASGIDVSKFEIIEQGKSCPYANKLDSILSWNEKHMRAMDKSLNKKVEELPPTKVEEVPLTKVEATTQTVTVDVKAVEGLTKMVEEEKEILIEMEERIEEDVQELEEIRKDIKDAERRHRHHERKGHHVDETSSAPGQSWGAASLLLGFVVSCLASTSLHLS